MYGELNFESMLPLPLIIFLLLVIFVVSIYTNMKNKRLTQLLWKILFIGIRTIAIFIVLVCLTGPIITGKTPVYEKRGLVFLIDNSQSMYTEGNYMDKKIQEVLNIIKKDSGLFQKLQKKYDVSIYEFGKYVSKCDTDFAGMKQRKQNATAIGNSLAFMLKKMKEKKCEDLILISDGRNTYGQNPIDVCARFKQNRVKIHSIGVGKVGKIKDQSIQSLSCPPIILINSPIQAKVYLQFTGLKGCKAKVTFKVEKIGEASNQTVFKRKRTLHIFQDQQKEVANFEFAVEQKGCYKISVDLASLAGEMTFANNFQSTFIFAHATEFKVCLIETKPSWEGRFLRRFLREMKLIAVDFVDILQIPVCPFEDYDVVIFIGFPKYLDYAELGKIISKRGSGCVFIAGSESLCKGATQCIKIASVSGILPVYPGNFVTRGVKFTPDSRAEEHFIYKSAGKKILKNYQVLPPFDSYMHVERLKTGATCLARTQQGDPILIVQDYGKGRCAFVCADTTWKWMLFSKESAEIYKILWNNLILWLAKKDKDRRFWIDIKKNIYLPQEPVKIRAFVEKPIGTIVKDADVFAEITTPDKKTSKISAFYHKGRYNITYVPLAKGDYQIRIVAKVKDLKKPDAINIFIKVIEISPELENTFIDTDTLKQISNRTGGIFTWYDPTSVFNKLLKKKYKMDVTTKIKKNSLWDNQLLILLFCLFVGIEWLIRRLKRLS